MSIRGFSFYQLTTSGTLKPKSAFTPTLTTVSTRGGSVTTGLAPIYFALYHVFSGSRTMTKVEVLEFHLNKVVISTLSRELIKL